MRETRLWNKIRDNAPGKWVRVENSLSSGFPDCIVLYQGAVSLVELKSVDGYGGNMGLTKVQMRWMNTWCELGGRAFALIRTVSKRHGIEIFLVSGHALHYGAKVDRMFLVRHYTRWWLEEIDWMDLGSALWDSR